MERAQVEQLWESTKKVLAGEMSEISFNTWISPIEAISYEEETLNLRVPNDFHKSFAEQYIPLIRNSIKTSYGTEMIIQMFISGSEPSVTSSPLTLKTSDIPEDNGSYRTGRINPQYSFDTFVVGSGNRFAHAACVAVAEKQGGRNFNPLFLYGGSGLGKTHLMHAIGNSIRKRHPDKSVLYVQSEQFVNEFIMTIKENKYDDFRGKYRSTDILLIDDIQFIEGKNEMQIEFFHTFNSLYESGKHIVMTCDKPPQSLAKLEERLRTRFSCGLTVDIQPPDYETRIAILKKRAQLSNSEVPEEVFEYIASNIATNIRELEGAFNTVLCYSLLAGGITTESAKEALKDMISPVAARKVTCEFIIDIVSNFYNITPSDLKSKRRSNEVAVPRHIAMYLCRNILDMTFPQIGSEFGNRDHSTVMHACSKISDEINAYTETRKDIDELIKRIKG
ncbi:MAG: chromosomal replication initiator protein DnaA [Eubacteriales bacterium]|nr:chromosomal replication initiator protein DnaA [Eubacteriales bacterium]MDD4717851.1 chromosomal replication initiator protein DnaA [Eubacteriales bacterium]